eukprot:6485652-Amphidinium_carterae.2
MTCKSFVSTACCMLLRREAVNIRNSSVAIFVHAFREDPFCSIFPCPDSVDTMFQQSQHQNPWRQLGNPSMDLQQIRKPQILTWLKMEQVMPRRLGDCFVRSGFNAQDD